MISGRRCTLHAIPTGQFDDKEEVLKLLLEVSRLHVVPSITHLDRGFYTVGCLRFLEERGGPYLMPARKDKKLAAEMREYAPESRVVGTRGWSYHKKVRPVGRRNNKVEVQPVFLYRPDEDEGGGGSVFTPATSALILVVIVLAVLGSTVMWMRYRGVGES